MQSKQEEVFLQSIIQKGFINPVYINSGAFGAVFYAKDTQDRRSLFQIY